MRTLGAFLLRDLRVARSYRISFVTQSLTMVFSLLSVRFVAELLGDGAGELTSYGGDYFSFAVIGIALSMLAYPATRSFGDAVHAAQMTGTFEAQLCSRARPTTMVVASGVYALVAALLQLALGFAFAMLVLGAEMRPSSLGVAFLVVLGAIAALAGVGLLSAAFTIAFKQREPLSGMFIAASFLLSGVLYPTSVLPSWLEPLASLLPLTHALELARGALLVGAEPDAMAGHAAALAASAAALAALGVWSLSAAFGHARSNGTLSHY